MSIFRLIRWIAEGDQIILYGDGTQERDFTFVEDIARGTVLALKPVGYELINLGNDHPLSLRRVIALLESMLGRTARLKQEPSHPADAFATWADIQKARLLLGGKPHTSFEQGLRAAVDWYLANRAWASEILLGDSADPQPQPEQA
jgi:UDP-glucuronate 4-epimerase